MARRRRKKEADLAKAIVGLTILSVYFFQRHFEIIKLIFVFLIAGGVIAGLLVYLLRQRSDPYHFADSPRFPLSHEKDGGHLFESSPTSWSLDLIRRLDWKRFEELCAAYFSAEGYKAKVTNLGADGGIDVLIYGKDNPDEVVGVVQCKAWTDKPVGVREVRELLGAMTAIGCTFGVYFATSEYTLDAKTFAESNNIKLIDAVQLLDSIKNLPPATQAGLLKQITSGDYTTPSCPSCGIKLVTRVSKSGRYAGQKFWGCHNYPRCRYTMRAKSA